MTIALAMVLGQDYREQFGPHLRPLRWLWRMAEVDERELVDQHRVELMKEGHR